MRWVGGADAITDKPITIHPTENVNEFVANVLRDNMGMINFDLRSISQRTLWHYNSVFGSSLSTSSEMRSVMTFSLHSASIYQILEPNTQNLLCSCD